MRLKASLGSEQYQAMKLIDGVIVNAARGWRTEAVEYRQFTMIQVWKPKHSATVIRLDSVFAHGNGLPCRKIGTTANRLGDASSGRGRAVGEYGLWRVL